MAMGHMALAYNLKNNDTFVHIMSPERADRGGSARWRNTFIESAAVDETPSPPCAASRSLEETLSVAPKAAKILESSNKILESSNVPMTPSPLFHPAALPGLPPSFSNYGGWDSLPPAFGEGQEVYNGNAAFGMTFGDGEDGALVFGEEGCMTNMAFGEDGSYAFGENGGLAFVEDGGDAMGFGDGVVDQANFVDGTMPTYMFDPNSESYVGVQWMPPLDEVGFDNSGFAFGAVEMNGEYIPENGDRPMAPMLDALSDGTCANPDRGGAIVLGAAETLPVKADTELEGQQTSTRSYAWAEDAPATQRTVAQKDWGDGTTVMLRNVPNKYTRDMLVDQLNRDLKGVFDFVYLPIDFRNGCNVGYGFINFCTVEARENFVELFDGVQVSNCLPGLNSQKVAEVTPARIHGLEPNVKRLRNSPVMSELAEHPEWMPLIFDRDGQEVAFPSPDGPIPEVRPRHRSADGNGRRHAAAAFSEKYTSRRSGRFKY